MARPAELLTELLGAPISQGSLAGWYLDAANGLDAFDEVLCTGLVGAGVVGADETGTRVGGALAWVHAARTDALTRYTVSGKRGADTLVAELLVGYRHSYCEFINPGWAANPDHHPGGRGKGKRCKHVNLLDRLDTHRDEVLRYADDLQVPFTNNGSEQDIRPLKVRMKVAGCLRTKTGAESFCRLRSYLSTARKQGQSSFVALRMLHDGNAWIPAIAGRTS